MNSSRPIWKFLFLGFVISSILIVLAVSKNIPALDRFITDATTRRIEKVTELYFEDHINLPKYIQPNGKYTFKFTVHNLEGEDKSYIYRVIKQVDTQIRVIDQGMIQLKNDEYATIDKEVGPFENERTNIQIELVNEFQKISFWLEKVWEKLLS